MTVYANQWGLLNWRDPSAYGDTSKWSKLRWRWEFTRRREDIRRYFLEYAEDTHQALVDSPDYSEMRPEEGKTPSDPGFWAMLPNGVLPWLVGIPNPAISDQPMIENLFEDARVPLIFGKGRDYLNFDDWHYEYFAEGTVAIVVNLNRPLLPQLASAKVELESYARPRQRRWHSSKWLIYLRALDGREAGASWAEIASELLGRAQKEQIHAPQSAKEIWDQACSLMFNWPV